MSSPAAGGTDSGAADGQPLPDVRGWTPRQRLQAEKDTLGLYLSGHPMDELREELAEITTATFEEIGDLMGSSVGNGDRRNQGRSMTLAGMIAAIRRRPGKIGRAHV